ncbi:major facilitator transporter [Arthrobacter sp. PAMC 25486]|uniref:MFS transporter n=1 Tax=Arthrobacter sp. PAMC 25486 TaxID=1494608 RepID=UPI00053634F3|nr:MFS transporter [Arthrobacter sp. PAMC 25486]AIY03179.1 major facilitator transporter [Arthrobacter sp. PAMC 25486]
MSTNTTSRRALNRVAASAFAGTAMEWYDYILYGTASAVVFAHLFFPSHDLAVATMLSFATFAAGFVARPLGAIIFGHLGDKLGRRTAVIGSIVLMGISTGVIGLLPNYPAVGIIAPLALLLLRLFQGISAGGEWGGAMVLVLEHAPKKKHGIYAAIPQLGSPVATLLSTGALAIVATLPNDDFLTWGWRIPFLMAFPFLGVALYLRFRVEESPVFKQMQAEHVVVKVPLVSAIRHTGGRMLLGGMAALLGGSGFFIMTTFMISYGTNVLGFERQTMLNATLFGAVAQIVVIVVSGRMADKIGAWKVCAGGALISALAAFPVFALVDTGNAALATLGVVLGMGALTIPYGPIGSLLSGMFPAQYRYSAMAVSYNVFGIIGGFLPIISQVLLVQTGNASWGVALLLMGVSLISMVGAIGAGSRGVAAKRAKEDIAEQARGTSDSDDDMVPA